MPTFTPPTPVAQSTPLSILVTGASRGIGLELVRQYAVAHPSNIVIAAARNPSTPALASLASTHLNVHPIPLDISSPASITAAVPLITALTPHLDLLFNNAGIHGPDDGRDPLRVSPTHLSEVFHTNVTGTVLTTRALLPLLTASPHGAKVVNLSSSMGSIARSSQLATEHGYLSLTYGCSKAALNYATMVFKHAEPKVAFLAIHPGWYDILICCVLLLLLLFH